MIISFADKETRKVFQQKFSKRLPVQLQKLALRKLMLLDKASNLNDLRVPPSNHLEKLNGSKSRYSIRINRQFRICFYLQKENYFYSVQIIDYH